MSETISADEKCMLAQEVNHVEHGLYSFARAFIRLPAIRNAMNPQVKYLFLYHLLEEAEHGAVSHALPC